MFFTPDLLSRRDSGFGLLWLAATLGAKSSFKKLPKRDVLGADIAQLCDLIIQPAEPLALRLSSNLMVGVARVYKIKHEIFLGDVTSCFAALKKAVHDLNALSSASLQMGQPSVRPDAVTVTADPAMALELNFDDLMVNWQDLMEREEDDGSDDVYGKPKKRKAKDTGKRAPSLLETARANLHTLNESLEQMLSGSFEASFGGSGGAGQDSFSSQPGDCFGFGAFGDDPFAADIDLGLGDIGDELAQELGEGWGSAPVKLNEAMDVDMDFHVASDPVDPGMDFDQGGGFLFSGLGQGSVRSSSAAPNNVPSSIHASGKKRTYDNVNQDPPLPQSQMTRTPIPPWELDQGLLPADNPTAAVEVEAPVLEEAEKPAPRKPKCVRLLLDARIELTDDELKAARAQYVRSQESLRREREEKRMEKESGRLIDEMLYSVPLGLQAPVLVDFWLENFKVQVEARSGALHLEATNLPTAKRRRVGDQTDKDADIMKDVVEIADRGAPPDREMEEINAYAENAMYQDHVEFGAGSAHQRSSEEPGQGRHVSRPPSPLGAFDFNFGREPEPVSASQKSSLFPWDNAGPSSSVNGAVLFDPGSDRVTIGHSEVRIRGGSLGRSKRDSSLIPSQFGSAVGGVGFSPGAFGKVGSQIDGENFEFDVPAEGQSLVEDTQQSDLNLVTLERNSFNFLEYAKMQIQTLQQPSEGLIFDNMVPKNTSTPHVAASAFYHCLVLATKHLIRVEQPEPYGALKIRIT